MNTEEKNNNLLNLQEEADKRTIFRIQKNKEDPYVRINKSSLQDDRISWKARGILGYMLTLPDDWVFYREELLKHAPDGRKSLLSGLKELKTYGYLKIIAEKNNKGKVVRWVTHVFETPQPIEKTQNPKKGNLGKIQNPLFENVEKGECRKGTTTNNRSKQTIDLNNNKQAPTHARPKPELQNPFPEPDPNVVASLIEKTQQWAIAETLLRTWLRKHSAEYILDKIEYTKSYPATKNPAGLLRRAIENDYKLPVCKQAKLESKVPAEPVYPTHEENLAWYAGLSGEGKQICFEQAKHKHSHFETMLKNEKLDFKSLDFLNSHWFKMMMQLVERSK